MSDLLIDELTRLLNYHNQEGNSDTPDFLLAEYLLGCLQCWNKTVARREEWFGRSLHKDRPTTVEEVT